MMVESEPMIFVNTVRKEFRFLQEIYRFRYIDSRIFADAGAVVRYESPEVWFEIWYDHLRGGEFSINMGLLAREELIIALPYHLMAYSSPSLERCLHQFAESVAHEAQPLLLGETSAFQRSLQEQQERSAQWWCEDRLNRIRAEALDAWQRKDYGKVIAFYESMGDDLSEAEQKRLALARKYKGSS
jgi:hypothetical protein